MNAPGAPLGATRGQNNDRCSIVKKRTNPVRIGAVLFQPNVLYEARKVTPQEHQRCDVGLRIDSSSTCPVPSGDCPLSVFI